MAAVSVIVPIYNVERYLARALDSLLAQSFEDWEAILVNDGSTDGCGEIMAAYAAKDGRFRTVNRTNGGLSVARNCGLEIATGRYLMFLDSDDFLHPQTMELCMAAAERDGSDIVAFTYDRRYRVTNMVRHVLHIGDSKPKFIHFTEPEYLVTDNIFDYATEFSRPRGIDKKWAVKHCQACFKMYRMDMVRGMRFIPGIIYEDFPWWSEAMLRASRTTILNLPLYFYYPNYKSIVLSADQTYRIASLRRAIDAGKALFADVSGERREAWERNFLIPFERKLAKKVSSST